jgi:prephenate dehydrogenase
VRVTKIGGSIVVDVNDENETVHVSTPIRAMESAIEELAAAGPAQTR